MVAINALEKATKRKETFMDLSKTFDTLNNNFLIAKLNAYGSFTNARKLV